jgi:hypothetical protein
VAVAAPFCSERCRTIDLGRWLGETYALPELTDVDDDLTAEEGSSDEHESRAGHSSKGSV